MKNVPLRLRAVPLSLIPALAAALGALPAHADLPTVQARAAVEAAPAVGASGLAQAGLGMVLVLGLIFACAWVARRFGLQRLGGGGNLVKVVSSASVGQRERVVVVEVGATWLVLGVTPTQVNALHTLAANGAPQAPLAPAPTPASSRRLGAGAAPAADTPSTSANAASFEFDPVSQFARKLHESLTAKTTLTHP